MENEIGATSGNSHNPLFDLYDYLLWGVQDVDPDGDVLLSSVSLAILHTGVMTVMI